MLPNCHNWPLFLIRIPFRIYLSVSWLRFTAFNSVSVSVEISVKVCIFILSRRKKWQKFFIFFWNNVFKSWGSNSAATTVLLLRPTIWKSGTSSWKLVLYAWTLLFLFDVLNLIKVNWRHLVMRSWSSDWVIAEFPLFLVFSLAWCSLYLPRQVISHLTKHHTLNIVNFRFLMPPDIWHFLFQFQV